MRSERVWLPFSLALASLGRPAFGGVLGHVSAIPFFTSSHRERFQREAAVLASLNHPNIAIIHGLEKDDGIRRS